MMIWKKSVKAQRKKSKKERKKVAEDELPIKDETTDDE